MDNIEKKIIIIAGPTASGKSDFAVKIAKKYNGEIINCDSMQLYKNIPILSAQPDKKFHKDIVHKLYEILSPSETSTARKFLDLVKESIDKTHFLGKIPIIVGGTGLYIKVITDGISEIPEVSQEIKEHVKKLFIEYGNSKFYELLISKDPISKNLNINDSQRILRAAEIFEYTGMPISYWQNNREINYYKDIKFINILLFPERKILYEKCNSRFIKMIELGAIDEVRNLISKPHNQNITKAIGISEIYSYLNGDLSIDDAISQAQLRTRRYAKRQFTWFNNQMQSSNKIYYNNFFELEDIDLEIDI